MNDRRNFIKKCIASVAGIGTLSGKIADATAWSELKAHGDIPIPTVRTTNSWHRTIFCQSNSQELRTALNECAKAANYRVWYCDDDCPDLYAIGSFIQIVDRHLLGKDTWHQYVLYCDEVYDDVPCLLLDDIRDWELPKAKYLVRYNLNHKEAIPSIVQLIKQMRTDMDKNLPEAFKNVNYYAEQKTVILSDGRRRTSFDD